jgi:hypothetical protein
MWASRDGDGGEATSVKPTELLAHIVFQLSDGHLCVCMCSFNKH